MMTNREVELKLLLSSEGYERLFEKLAHVGHPRKQINKFYDSEEGVLRSERWALRLRCDDGHWWLTAKGPSDGQDGISDREELEMEISSAAAEVFRQDDLTLSSLLFEPAQRLLKDYGNMSLVEWMSFENSRQVLSWDGLSLELDHSVCGASHRYELELELPKDQLLMVRGRLENWLNKNSIHFEASDQGKLSWAVSQVMDS